MLRMAGAAGLVIAAAMLLAGCADTCSATPDKLAALQRGMSYEEAEKVMGCSGRLVSSHGPVTGEVSTVEWNGPGSMLFTATEIDFLDNRLLYYTTRSRTGF